ncbi:unnamed protein product [Didymodactylos carnosus]|uniref:Deacetylase sirtuin-type domain-containing protein n=1 Tax=Didymodactylos carnosus TaxID=1234261 RepID=A0A813WE40_9BILA|nr:unnamed protein product [Didymodactylos carnosus]CAF1373572.1 unnamed protein product [Didymodactylos carnosus]CAF3641541.1 unnamed protein product [Didymodactylos carnosus]CAF4182454.1 unnamed protein product [Didymodactylos carnosus]
MSRKTSTSSRDSSQQSRSLHRFSNKGTNKDIQDLTDKLNRFRFGGKSAIRRSSTTAKNYTLDDLVQSIKTGKIKRIVVLAGAGISTLSGIPDFRQVFYFNTITPGTGLYDNLQRYNIPYPEAIFELSYFRRNPKPFFHLAKELYPGRYQPNIIHYFMRYLNDKQLLHRLYTQNIDSLERAAGVPVDKIVEAHGTFMTATCLKCRQKHTCDEIREQIFNDKIPLCIKTKNCQGTVKPDIVFFGEDLPRRFQLYMQDLPMCDCCIVMGTSLAVYPFADIVDCPARSTPRLLINREIVGTFVSPRLYDVMMINDLEYSVKELLTKLEWIDDIKKLMNENNKPTSNKSNNHSNNNSATNDRLKAAEAFLQQKRHFSTFQNANIQQSQRTKVGQLPKSVYTTSTKLLIEKRNDALLLNRRNSKSAIVKKTVVLTSSSSDNDDSIMSFNSSISDTELKPFSLFKSTKSISKAKSDCGSTENNSQSKLKRYPLFHATLRTDT